MTYLSPQNRYLYRFLSSALLKTMDWRYTVLDKCEKINEKTLRESFSSCSTLDPGSELGTLCYQCKTGTNPRKRYLRTAEAVRWKKLLKQLVFVKLGNNKRYFDNVTNGDVYLRSKTTIPNSCLMTNLIPSSRNATRWREEYIDR